MCSRGDLEERVHEVRLDNGMRWLLLKRGYAPVFAGVVQVKVGGADEEPGKTGLAHFFEHMAFKGTTSIGTKNFEAEKEIMARIDKSVDEENIEEVLKLAKEQKRFIVTNEIWDILKRNGAVNINASTSKEENTPPPLSSRDSWSERVAVMTDIPSARKILSLLTAGTAPKAPLWQQSSVMNFSLTGD